MVAKRTVRGVTLKHVSVYNFVLNTKLKEQQNQTLEIRDSIVKLNVNTEI